MARSKKKKWKSRIKKALKLAAIGGAGYLAAKRFGGKKATVADTAASEDANIGVTHPALTATAPVIRKDVPPVNTGNIGNTITRTSGITTSPSGQLIGAGGLQGGQSRGELAQAMAANAAKNKAMNYQRSQTFDARPRNTAIQTKGRNFSYKKGGRVTGIAKRGFGRALMKGKK